MYTRAQSRTRSTGPAPAQQSKDEGECYNWAVQNTGSDPSEVTKQTGKGTGAKGRAKGRRQKEEATAQAEQQGQAAAQVSTGQLDNFKKAFSVCLEAKKYMVKY